MVSDYLLTGNKFLLPIRLAERCSLCGSKNAFTIKELRVVVIPNGCEESLIIIYN